MDTRTSPIRLRIDRLRELLQRERVQALLVPSSDPHLSEYLPGHWQGREWFSGFTGSMGTLVVTAEQALLFADGRYWDQAERELAGTGVTLERIATGTSPAHIDWLATHVARGQTVAVDGQVLGLAAALALQAALDKAGVLLRTDRDLLAPVWPERPALPTAPVYEHRAPHATQSRAAKLAAVREAMAMLVDRKSVQDFIYGRTGVATPNFLNNPPRFKSNNLKFEFNDAPDAEIRIGFDASDGAWSYIGTDCRSIPRNEATMNLGFMDGGTAAHEFGHAIGLAHEHQNPAGGIQWNEAVVIREMAGSPNFWDEQTTRHNILARYRADQVNSTKFDPASIMLYFFPVSYTHLTLPTSDLV